jgi:hypothetical protein
VTNSGGIAATDSTSRSGHGAYSIGADGVPGLVRLIRDGISATTARWQRTFSLDGGAPWETDWVMSPTRDEP